MWSRRQPCIRWIFYAAAISADSPRLYGFSHEKSINKRDVIVRWKKYWNSRLQIEVEQLKRSPLDATGWRKNISLVMTVFGGNASFWMANWKSSKIHFIYFSGVHSRAWTWTFVIHNGRSLDGVPALEVVFQVRDKTIAHMVEVSVIWVGMETHRWLGDSLILTRKFFLSIDDFLSNVITFYLNAESHATPLRGVLRMCND